MHTKEELIILIERYQTYIAEIETKNIQITDKSSITKGIEINKKYDQAEGSPLQSTSINDIGGLGSQTSTQYILAYDKNLIEEDNIKLANIVDILLSDAAKNQRNDLIAKVQKTLESKKSNKLFE